MYGCECDCTLRFSDADLDRPCACCGVMIGDHPCNQEYCRGSRIRVASQSPPPVIRQGLTAIRTIDVSTTSIPTEFVPRYGDKTSYWPFQPGTTTKASPVPRRFVNQDNPNEFLIYTDGCCLNNGQANPRAGCSAIFRPPTRTRPYYGRVSFALENRGPTGEPHPQTSNRAELRAVIAALRF
jgi:ribonuclease HI